MSRPLNGATDVLAAPTVTVVFWFDEKASFPGSTKDVITLHADNVLVERGTATKVAAWRLDNADDRKLITTVTKTITEAAPTEADPKATKDVVLSGIKLAFPSDVTLEDGKKYKITLPAVSDAAGNAGSTVVTYFSTLAKTADATLPTILEVTPKTGSTSVANASTDVTIYFSEKVSAKQGKNYNKKVGTAEPTAVQVVADNTSMVTFKLEAAALADSTAYILTVDAGAFVDGTGTNALEGTGTNDPKDGVVLVTSINAAVADKAFLTTIPSFYPANETTATYTHPVSRVVRINFPEDVKAGTGAITFDTMFDSPKVVVRAADTKIFDGKVLVLFDKALSPGEVYTISIDADAFTDKAGNKSPAYPAADATAHKFSTRAILAFEKVGSTHFDDPAVLDDAFTGEVYGLGAAVTDDNMIFAIGGFKTAGVQAVLNNVHAVATKRAVDCAAGFQEPGKCGTTCTSIVVEGQPTRTIMGKSTIQKSVWRMPGVGGKPCINNNDEPVTTGKISSTERECACAQCLTGVPDDVHDANIVQAQIAELKDLTMQKVTLDTTTIRCKTGWSPEKDNDKYTCVYDTNFVGKWPGKAMSPKCMPSPCNARPAALANQYTPTEQECATTQYVGHCACMTIDATTALAHGGTCGVSCAAGYSKPTDRPALFTCKNGVYLNSPGDAALVTPSCAAKTCDVTKLVTVANGSVCKVAKTGDDCALTCNAGYALAAGATTSLSCEADGATAEAEVKFSGQFAADACVKQSCGALPTGDFTVADGGADGGNALGSVRAVTCNSTFKAPSDTPQVYKCSAGDDGSVSWTGPVSCTKIMCTKSTVPSVTNGSLDCSKVMEAGSSECTLSCEADFRIKAGAASPAKCDATGTWTAGDSGACEPKSCAFGATIDGLASHTCTSVEDGAECNDYVCGAGREKMTPFSCDAGKGTNAACRAIVEGDDVREVNVSMTFAVEATAAELDTITAGNDKKFNSAFKASVASALDGVLKKDVTINKIVVAETKTRRRLAAQSIQVDYTVTVNKAAADAVKTALDSPATFNTEFAKSMTENGQTVDASTITVKAQKPSVPVDNTGAIIGGAVGGVLALLLIICIVVMMKKKKE